MNMLYMIYTGGFQMQWAIQVVIIILLTSLAWAGEKVSVAALLQNPERYDGKTVIVEREITSYKEKFSRRGNSYRAIRILHFISVRG
jgi:hypothetical protein